MTSRQITDILCRARWKPRTHVLVPNVSWGLGIAEADLLVVHKSGFAEEVEIKISKSDFKREFETKATKHRKLVHGCPKRIYNIARNLFEDDWSQVKPHICRRFWFAMPIDLARALEHEIPEHSGLLGVDPEGSCWSRQVVELKAAPVLKHSRKLTDAEQKTVLRLAYLRYWDIRHREAATP